MEISHSFVLDILKICMGEEYYDGIYYLYKNMKRDDFKDYGHNKICFYYESSDSFNGYHPKYYILSIDLNNNNKISINTNLIQIRTKVSRGITDYTELYMKIKSSIKYEKNFNLVSKLIRKQKLEQIARVTARVTARVKISNDYN